MTPKRLSILSSTAAALLLFTLSAGCGPSRSSGDDDDEGQTTPSVVSNYPLDGASDVPLNGNLQATFSEEMDPATVTASTFTLTSGAAETPVLGTVIYSDSTAVFWPTAYLASNGSFTATISIPFVPNA